ncbi:hypothetical protein KP509_12G024500 [Ceratopteris richardii]|uniref:Uncharacterized protein n=1 Tax=Ceratopteris richardii TaxID=49495 RepID=A0A8T2TMU4_CERRI|nr:hypothetical protein KP509_12G024500 [Ceratopteris richardii]
MDRQIVNQPESSNSNGRIPYSIHPVNGRIIMDADGQRVIMRMMQLSLDMCLDPAFVPWEEISVAEKRYILDTLHTEFPVPNPFQEFSGRWMLACMREYHNHRRSFAERIFDDEMLQEYPPDQPFVPRENVVRGMTLYPMTYYPMIDNPMMHYYPMTDHNPMIHYYPMTDNPMMHYYPMFHYYPMMDYNPMRNVPMMMDYPMRSVPPDIAVSPTSQNNFDRGNAYRDSNPRRNRRRR